MMFLRHVCIAVLVSISVGGLSSAAHADEGFTPRSERGWLQYHLSHVETTLRQQDVSHLPPALKQARIANLDALRNYWEAGVFPRNDGFTQTRVPYFFDSEGRSCAMAHLMVASGHADAAWAVSERENNAYVHDMTSPELTAWIKTSGLSVDEAAWIQPSYSPPCECPCEPEPVCNPTTGRSYPNLCTATDCGFEMPSDLVTGCCDAESYLEYAAGGASASLCNTDQASVDTQWCVENYDPEVSGDPIEVEGEDVGHDADVGVGGDVGTFDVGAMPDSGSSAPTRVGDDEDAGGCTVLALSSRTATPWAMLFLLVGFVLFRRR